MLGIEPGTSHSVDLFATDCATPHPQGIFLIFGISMKVDKLVHSIRRFFIELAEPNQVRYSRLFVITVIVKTEFECSNETLRYELSVFL